ncbi:MAG: hypothetical protein A3E88_04600 [Legionellales bacterium RIFCSPHIGHO2_12_FULL_35_11]|nr:MAG: hypothetical protein A3E88_04600 [Legionellales bacterium RIFCSPHIGHO2_12_FULL_35_11]
MKYLRSQTLLKYIVGSVAVLFAGSAFAASETLGTMAAEVTSSFANVGLMITAASYIAGLGFAVSAILKFKQHKDNPQQTPIGQPVGLIAIAIALLFLPSILTAAGNTVFSEGATTSGATGSAISSTTSSS